MIRQNEIRVNVEIGYLIIIHIFNELIICISNELWWLFSITSIPNSYVSSKKQFLSDGGNSVLLMSIVRKSVKIGKKAKRVIVSKTLKVLPWKWPQEWSKRKIRLLGHYVNIPWAAALV